MSFRLHTLDRDEEGIALVSALFAIVVLSGLAVLFVATAVGQMRATGRERDFEMAIHVAEAGADSVLADVNIQDEAAPYTTNSNGAAHVYSPPSGLSDEQLRTWEEQWAVTYANSAAAAQMLDTNRGAGFGIRPTCGSARGACAATAVGTAAPVVFGVGFVPDRVDPVRTRVVKLEFDREPNFVPDFAILTNGNLIAKGSFAAADGTITGLVPSGRLIHSNGNLTVNLKKLGGKVSAAPYGPAGTSPVHPAVTGTINNSCTDSAKADACTSQEQVVELIASEMYSLHTEERTENVLWYDLCPDGTMRLAGGSPCTGTTVPPASQGWSLSGFDWSSNSVAGGVYYVHQGNATINGTVSGGGAGRIPVTVIAAGTDSLGQKGNIKITGNGKMIPALPNLTLMADRDIVINGNPVFGTTKVDEDAPQNGACQIVDATEVGGLVYAGEQISSEGSPNITGAIVTFGRTTAQSFIPGYENKLQGNFKVTFSCLDVPVEGTVRITGWNEL